MSELGGDRNPPLMLIGNNGKEDRMRKIGSRKERPITFSASGALLLEGARFNDEIHRLLTGQMTCIPKGVFFFKTHAEANQHQEDCLAACMAKIALERRRKP